jgi:hypothetical protein
MFWQRPVASTTALRGFATKTAASKKGPPPPPPAEKNTGRKASVAPASPIALKVSRRSKLNERRKQRRIRMQELRSEQLSIDPTADLPQRTADDFGAFFDRIMPPYTLSRMDHVLERIASKAQLAQPATVVPLPTVLQTVLKTTNNTNKLQLQVLHYLLQQEDPTRTSPAPVLAPDPAWVALLEKARERSVGESPLFWNKAILHQGDAVRLVANLDQHGAQTPEELHEQAFVLAGHLRNSMPTKYLKALFALLDGYVEEGAADHSEETESWSSVEPPAFSEEMAAAATSSTTSPRINMHEAIRRSPLRLLGPALYRTLKTHLSGVASDLADFFYLDLPTDSVEVTESRQRWQRTRDKFCRHMMELQTNLRESVKETYASERIRLKKDDNVEEPAIQVRFKKDDIVEELAIHLGSAAVQADVKVKEPRRAIKKLFHVAFDVSQPAAADDPVVQEGVDPLPCERRIFLDNLPIDVTEQDILDLYSRCGPITSVQLFNQRPDLDPGPLTKQQTLERRKKQLKSLGARYAKWQRPKTPVYGMVQFSDEEGYQRSMHDTLRIFGMVVRRHPVRSLPAARVTTLYLDSLAVGEACLELEHELEQTLDLQVSVAPGQRTNMLVGSCEIRFPSFATAWLAYCKLQEWQVVREGQGRLHWFKTLTDADKWWTRERGFDF